MTMTMIKTTAPDRLLDEAELVPRIEAVCQTIQQYIDYHTALGWHGRVERHETRLENMRMELDDVRTAQTLATRQTARRRAQMSLIELETAYRSAP